MTEAHKRIVAARTALVLDQEFWGVLCMQLRLEENLGCGTAWTDGTRLGYDPSFVMGLTFQELVTLFAHEAAHCAFGHPWRKSGRDHEKWNHACDYSVNLILKDAGFVLPDGVLLDQQFQGKSAEWIYDRLPDPPKNGGSGNGQGGSQQQPDAGESQQGQDSGGSVDPSGKLGEVRAAESGSDDGRMTEADWQQAVQQAALAAKARGHLPAGLERLAKDAAKPKVDWRSVLRRFVQEVAAADYSWTRPNRRYIPGGLYLPAMRSEQMGPIAIGVDTSGSIDAVMLEQFRAEVQAIADDMSPARTVVIYCDAKVHRIDTFERDDVIEFHPVGGGGTDFRPVFDALDKLEEPPVCLIYMTDLYGSFPQSEPEIPTLWITASDKEAPFGETVKVR